MCLSPRRRPVAPAQIQQPRRALRRGLVVPRPRLDARVTRLRGALHRIDHLLAEGLNAAMSEQHPADAAAARRYTEEALTAAEKVADDEDRALVLGDLETIPGQPRYW